MRKVFAAMLWLFLLCGCGSSDADLPNRLWETVSDLTKTSLQPGSNRVKQFYSYYLPQGMGQRDSTVLSEVLIKDGYQMVMNFDPSAIVIENYYTESAEDAITSSSFTLVNEEDLAVQMEKLNNSTYYSGDFISAAHKVTPYFLQISKGDDGYLVYLNATFVKLYTYVPRAEVISMVRVMFTISQSIHYDEDEILKAYSMKSLTGTKKESLDYLERHLPTSGSLEDLLNPDDNDDFDSDMPDSPTNGDMSE